MHIIIDQPLNAKLATSSSSYCRYSSRHRMSSFAPPPPPMIGGLAPPALTPPTAVAVALPPPPPAAAAMMRAPPPSTVLLTNVPSFLHSVRSLREWIHSSGGNARTILFLPAVADPNNDSSTSTSTTTATANVGAATTPEGRGEPITALVTLSHADGAAKFVAALAHVQSKLSTTAAAAAATSRTDAPKDEEAATTIEAHLVPNLAEVPLPPITMDPETVEILSNNLLDAWQNKKTANSAVAAANGQDATTSTDTLATKTKTTADTAATKGTDAVNASDDDEEEVDPLTTPAVLAAVRNFRRQLETQQGSKSTRRKELVNEKLATMLPVVRQRLQEEATRPPPPLATTLPPPPATVAAPTVTDSARRGVSNLPAWMTKQPADASGGVAATATQEPPSKRAKVETIPSLQVGNTDQAFPAVPAVTSDTLRQFIASQCQEYLGQEEATLIDFIHQHVLQQKAVSTLLPELQEVVEDDAAAFCQAVWTKTHELAATATAESQ